MCVESVDIKKENMKINSLFLHNLNIVLILDIERGIFLCCLLCAANNNFIKPNFKNFGSLTQTHWTTTFKNIKIKKQLNFALGTQILKLL